MKKEGLKKEVKNYERNVTIILVALTVISLIINVLVYTTGIYSDDTFYNTEAIRNVVNSGWFMTILWVDNIAIYVTNLFYFAGIIDSKRDMLVKISFGIFSILSTVLINVQIVNLVAGLFGII
ncbi:unknown [Firmicutes bacterium CAG:822]|nr:unknown [Firmicutes bacterium CAG:822]